MQVIFQYIIFLPLMQVPAIRIGTIDKAWKLGYNQYLGRNFQGWRFYKEKFMKIKAIVTNVAAAVLGAVGLLAAGLGVWLALNNTGSLPRLVERPENARRQVAAMLECVARGAYDDAGQLMLGSPVLGAQRLPEEEASQLLWQGFTDSFSYALVGELYPAEDGLRQDVRITALDFDSVTQPLYDYTRQILQQRLDEAQDVGQIYDEENNFREDVVMQAYREAMAMALARNGKTETVSLTVALTYQHGRWQIVPDGQLLDAISGGILNG